MRKYTYVNADPLFLGNAPGTPTKENQQEAKQARKEKTA